MKYKKKILILLSVILFFVLLYHLFFIGQYFYLRHKGLSSIESCRQKYDEICSLDEKVYDINEDYYLMHHLILPELLLYKGIYNNKPLTFVSQNCPINYIFPEEILNASDYVFSYGIGDRMYWEEITSQYYKKPMYAFDCGVRFKKSDIKSNYLTFCSECIGTDEFVLYNQTSSGEIHSVGSKLKELGITDKKVYLRFGIPEIHKIMPDVLKNKDNITGITFLTDFWHPAYIIDTMEMLKQLNEDFVLVSRNFLYTINKDLKDGKIKYTKGDWSIMLDLTYVNKNMLDSYYLPFNQSNYDNGKPSCYIGFHVDAYRKDGILKNVDKYNKTPGYYKYTNISWIVVMHQKMRNFYNKYIRS